MTYYFKRVLFRLLRIFRPSSTADSILDIDLVNFFDSGKRLVLIDIDNTLLSWSSSDISSDVIDWINRGKQKGLQFCLISNTLNKQRLSDLSNKMDVPFVKGRFKPSRQMFTQALERFKALPEQAIMIGDQMFTDILGASRMRIDSIWVRPATDKEFIGTKVNRFFEKWVCKGLSWSSKRGKVPASAVILDRNITRQFIKFLIVGVTSTTIDLGLHYILMFKLSWNRELVSHLLGETLVSSLKSVVSLTETSSMDMSFAFLKVITVSLAIANSFFWNRLWTFRITDPESRHQQFVKFILVAGVGLLLNTVVATTLYDPDSSQPQTSWLFASFIACGVVALWNFLGQKFWVFHKNHR